FVSITNALSDGEWNSYSKNQVDGQTKEKSIDLFRKFLGLRPIFFPSDTNVPPGRVHQVPFTPTRRLDLQLSWQANDPLVHYTLEDLYDPAFSDTNNVQTLKPRQSPQQIHTIGQINR